jgi:hypothetical protein
MAVTQEKVIVNFDAMTKGLMNGINRVRRGINVAKRNFSDFSSVITASLPELKKMNSGMRVMQSSGGKVAFRLREMTHGARGFRMEMLGIMFFGMAISRIFKGLMRTSLQWAGTMKILSAALGILFLPTALELNDWALKFLDIVGGMDGDTKKLTGKITLLAIGFGMLLSVIGAVALGIGSLILVVGNLFAEGGLLAGLVPTLKAALASLGSSFILILGVLLAVGAIIAGIFMAWRENFMGMREIYSFFIESVKNMFIGLIGIVQGVLNIIKGIFTGDLDLIIEGFKQIFVGLFEFVLNLVRAIGAVFGIIVIGVIKFLDNLAVLIGEAVLRIVDFFVASWKRGVEQIREFFEKLLPEWMINLFKKGFKISGGSGKKGNVLGFANGGIVPGPIGQPVPAIVHGGETVIPANGNASGMPSPQISIRIDRVSSDYDVRRIASEIKRQWTTDYERESKRRGR